METSVNAIIDNLHSSEPQNQLSGLDDAKALVTQLVRQSVEILFSASNPYGVAEKLFAMGPSVIPDLQRQLDEGGPPEAMAYAALVLLKLGSQKGVGQLFRSLKEGIGPTGMIAQGLATARVPGASEVITEVLMTASASKDPYTAVTLISALRELEAPVPEEAFGRLEQSAPNIRKLL